MERVTRRAGSNVMQSIDYPTMLVVGDVMPVTITLPKELGGTTLRCLGCELRKCPLHDHEVPMYILEEEYYVFECGSQFFWCRYKGDGEG